MIRSSVQRLHAYTPGEQPREPGIIKLNTNENPYPPSPRVAEVLRSIQPDRLRLYPDPVCTELRKRLAALHGCTVDHVFVGNGSDEVLALAVRAFVERDQSVGYFQPSYSLYPVLAAIEDVRTVEVPLTRDFQWVSPSDCGAALFYLTNPNAPTSMMFPQADVEAFCRAYRGVVLLDEAYADFAAWNGMGLALDLPNVLVSRSFSKSFSLAGLRLGYCVGAKPLIEAMFKIKDSYNVDLLAQEIGCAAVDDIAWMRANVAKVKATRERVRDALLARGFHVPVSETNFLWARPGKGEAAVLFEALRARKIYVRYFPGATTGAFLRITIGTDEQMKAFLDTVDAIHAGP